MSISPKNHTTGQPAAFMKKRDIILIVALLAVAVLGWVLLRSNSTQPGAAALVTIGLGEKQTTQQVDLSKNGIVHIEGGKLPVQLEVKDGAIRFVHSVCPDHLCEGYGWLSMDNDWAACLPAEVAVRVQAPASNN